MKCILLFAWVLSVIVPVWSQNDAPRLVDIKTTNCLTVDKTLSRESIYKTLGITRVASVANDTENTVLASYKTPEGVFYWGFNQRLQTYAMTAALAATNCTHTFVNTTNSSTSSFLWEYRSKGTHATTSNMDNLVLTPRGYSNIYMPTLFAISDEDTETSFAIDVYEDELPLYFGGNMRDSYNHFCKEITEEDCMEMMCMPYCYSTHGLTNPGIAGKGDAINKFYRELLSDPSATCDAIGFFLPASPHPYLISQIMFPVTEIDCADDAQFKLELFDCQDDKPCGDPVAVSVLKGSDVVSIGAGYNQLTFTLCGEDSRLQYIETSGNMYARVTMDDGVRTCSFFTQGKPNADGRCNSAVELTRNGKTEILPLSALSTSNGPMYVDYSVNMDVCFSWINIYDALNGTFREITQLNGDATTVAFDVESYFPAENLIVSNCPDWITYKVTDAGESNYECAYALRLELAVAANTTGVDRSEVLTLSIPGASRNLRVAQNTTSSVDNIITSEPSTVQYFNIQGLPVTEGSLAPGIYIRKQGDKVSKVVVHQ